MANCPSCGKRLYVTDLWRETPDQMAGDGRFLTQYCWCPHCGKSLQDSLASRWLLATGVVLASLVLVAGSGWTPLVWSLPVRPLHCALAVGALFLMLSLVAWRPEEVPAHRARPAPLRPVAGHSRIEFFTCPVCEKMSVVVHGTRQRMLFWQQPVLCPACQRSIDINPRFKVAILLTSSMMLTMVAYRWAILPGHALDSADIVARVLHLSVIPWTVLLIFACGVLWTRNGFFVANGRRTPASVTLHFLTMGAALLMFVLPTALQMMKAG